MSLLLTAISVFFIGQSADAEWIWRGAEIIGNSDVELAEMLPYKIGDPYKEDREAWDKAALDIKMKHDFIFVQVTSVRYSNFDAFMVVDVVSKNQKERAEFRKISGESFDFVNPDILDLYEKFQKRLWSLFDAGKPPLENFDKGFLDWDDPEMHEISVNLSEKVPEFREHLFKVLASEPKDQRRVIAADLLNYIGGDLQEMADRAALFLDDPHPHVRNNISRFILHIPKLLKAPEVRKRLIKAFAQQLARPSHGDRNKAIINLLFLGKEYPQDLPLIDKVAGEWIRIVAEKSVLSNVRDPAVELLKLIQKEKDDDEKSGR